MYAPIFILKCASALSLKTRVREGMDRWLMALSPRSVAHRPSADGVEMKPPEIFEARRDMGHTLIDRSNGVQGVG